MSIINESEKQRRIVRVGPPLNYFVIVKNLQQQNKFIQTLTNCENGSCVDDLTVKSNKKKNKKDVQPLI